MTYVGSLAVCFAVLVTWVSGAGALEVKDKAKAKAPPGWWEASGPMAIPPQYFDQILSAYGLTLVDVSKAPATYARKVGDKVAWEMAPRTYTPVEMDQILSAYGVKLTDVGKCPPTYARVVDGKPVFESAPIAWGPREIDRILAAYQ